MDKHSVLMPYLSIDRKLGKEQYHHLFPLRVETGQREDMVYL